MRDGEWEGTKDLDLSRILLTYQSMKWMAFFVALCSLPPLMGQSPSPEILQAEIQELHTVLKSLRAENERLRRENRRLRDQAHGVAPQPMTSPSLTRTSPRTQPTPPPMVQDQGPKLLSVDPHWNTLIAAAGSDQGLKKGSAVRIVRRGRVLGTAIVQEVKPQQSILEFTPASPSLARSGIYPAAGDVVALP